MAPALNISSRLPMNSGHPIPRLGLGVYMSKNARQSVAWALEAGYRHIDSAAFYKNEAEVSEAVMSSGIARDEIFVTSKIGPQDVGDRTAKALETCLSKLQKGDHWDLVLLHAPTNGKQARITGWKTLVEAQKAGKIRAAGVSNFSAKHIQELVDAGLPLPALNQVEAHPWCQQREIFAYCEKHGIARSAYCPLLRAGGEAFSHPLIVELGKKHSKSPAQILIRYSLQKDWIPLPKSDNHNRIRENADVYDFEISAEDMARLDALDQGGAGAISWNPVNVA